MAVRFSLLSGLKAFISLVFASLSYFNLTLNTEVTAWVGKTQWRHQFLSDQVESSLLVKAPQEWPGRGQPQGFCLHR